MLKGLPPSTNEPPTKFRSRVTLAAGSAFASNWVCVDILLLPATQPPINDVYVLFDLKARLMVASRVSRQPCRQSRTEGSCELSRCHIRAKARQATQAPFWPDGEPKARPPALRHAKRSRRTVRDAPAH